MLPPFIVKKYFGEGTKSPFIARLFSGILMLRDNFLLFGTDERQKQIRRELFDKQYKPIFEAADATRDAAHRIIDLITNYEKEVRQDEVVKIKANQIIIIKTIDSSLGQLLDTLIDQSIVATKSGVQSILMDQLNLDIGFFFKGEKEFTKGITNLQKNNQLDLAFYLQEVRLNWHSNLQELRVNHEHRGWSLPEVEYIPIPPSSLQIILPKVDGIYIDDFAIRTTNRLLLFIENILAYAIQNNCAACPYYLVEIPSENRNPENPQRFKLLPRGLSVDIPWKLTYTETREFI